MACAQAASEALFLAIAQSSERSRICASLVLLVGCVFDAVMAVPSLVVEKLLAGAVSTHQETGAAGQRGGSRRPHCGAQPQASTERERNEGNAFTLAP